jgi:hypothetical protein
VAEIHATDPAPAAPVAPGEARGGRGDWLLRLTSAVPLGPVGAGLLAALLYDAAFLIFNGLAGTLDGWRLPDGSWDRLRLFSESMNGLLIGYLIAAYAIAHRGALADLARLRPVLDCTESEYRVFERTLTAPGAGLRLSATACALLSALLLVSLDPAVWDDRPRPGFFEPLWLWVLFRNLSVGWFGFRLAFSEMAMVRTFTRLGAEHTRVDLLDSKPLEPYVRKGMRSVVIWVLFSSAFSLFWLIGTAAHANLFLLILLLGMATAAFLLPLAGVRRRIVAAKLRELERVNDAIRREVGPLLAEPPASSRARLADLIAWRDLVEAVHEWPISMPALLRFVLFVLLGLGSWLGGAFVDRMLESALG